MRIFLHYPHHVFAKYNVSHQCVRSLPQCDQVPSLYYMVIEYRVVIVQNL